ncbi:MAG TPA: hypothetical protein VNX86_06290 [Rhizomicrobium sp.]|nr:hypothetical protein [Rhizomicrobium sp.]
MNPVFHDCEATGPNGYPIEVGWAYIDEAGALVSEGHLIRPPAEWDIESVWDEQAEAVHNIPLAILRAQGRPAFQVARRMNEALAGRELFSDSPADEDWLRKLFDAAGEEPSFTIRRTLANIVLMQATATRGLEYEAIPKAEQEASRTFPRTHRAEADARHLAALWSMIARGRWPG